MGRVGPAQGDACQEGDDGGIAAVQGDQGVAVAGLYGQGAVQAGFGQMLHQADEEGQVFGMDPLFVQGQDEGAAVGLEVEIGILDAFRDALEGQRRADIVLLQQPFQLLETDLGIDRHDGSGSLPKIQESLAFLTFYAFHGGAAWLWSAAQIGGPDKSGRPRVKVKRHPVMAPRKVLHG